MAVVASFSKVCVLNDNDIIYYNSIIFKSFHFGDRFQMVSSSVKKIIVVDHFRVDAR